MTKMNPIERSKYINSEYKEYLLSSFKFDDDSLQKLFEKELRETELFKGPYVDLNLPFKRGKSIRELVKEGYVCKSFLKLDDIDFDRPLYAHQEKALKHISSGHSAVVTTGTGSGKTECFLYPVINEMLKEIEEGNKKAGVRAIFLYPMNALVNDQIDRVRRILQNFSEIKFAFFTGDTPETASGNFRISRQEEEGIIIPDNELVSRKEIRQTPPHLLFTNYSMLEYLLIRPNDYSIFAPENLGNWKFVVLDEAHTYRGSLGIELAMLMRRLTGFSQKKPEFILTSATLGKENKSEEDIVKFAENLTSVKFSRGDIIFAKRILPDDFTAEYSVRGSDYPELKKHIDDLKAVGDICSKYKTTAYENVSGCLYELLSCDENVHTLYETLKYTSVSFYEIAEKMSPAVSEEELIALIDLINISEKDNTGLFTLKYHSFVRPLPGAFVTLGDNPRLSLVKTNVIEEKRAFEVGNCRRCNAAYIIGKIIKEKNGQDFLFQNKEIDIYENYGKNEFVNLDFFLIKKPEDNDYEVDIQAETELFEPYTVCSKCGNIYPSNNLNAYKCSCGHEFRVEIYKVLRNEKEEEGAFNNINQCPCCGNKSRTGVVKSLNLGKDEGTAMIAQMLLEAMDDDSDEKKSLKKLSLKKTESSLESPQNNIENKAKQFLSFSDSRQQASFAAVFFDSNHTRMLRKRLIWSIIENNNYKDISVNEMTALLRQTIKEKDLFQNDLNPQKNAWITVLIDLLRVDGVNDAEGVGLYYFDIDLSDIMNQFTQEDVARELGRYNLTKTSLEALIQVVLEIFKTTPAIDYTKSTLTPDEKKDYLEYRRFDNYIAYNLGKAQKNTRSFLPVKGKENKIVRYVKKACRCGCDEAKDLLDIIFNNLAVEGKILRKHETKDSYQISADQYVIKNYKSHKYYKCSKCGLLTPHNVNDVCVRDGCSGHLYEADPDVVLCDNYYRRKYKTKK